MDKHWVKIILLAFGHLTSRINPLEASETYMRRKKSSESMFIPTSKVFYLIGAISRFGKTQISVLKKPVTNH